MKILEIVRTAYKFLTKIVLCFYGVWQLANVWMHIGLAYCKNRAAIYRGFKSQNNFLVEHVAYYDLKELHVFAKSTFFPNMVRL